MTKKNISAAKLQEVITAKTLNSISNGSTTETKISEPKPEAKAKKATTSKKASTKKVETTTEKAIKEVKKQAKNNLLEEVVSTREVKYKYPADCTDTLSRKKWRQQVRNELKRLELEMRRVENQNSKEFKAKEKEYLKYKNDHLKSEAKVS